MLEFKTFHKDHRKKKNFLNANLKISYQYFYSKCSEQIKYTAKVAIGKCPIIQLTETLL